MKMKIPTSEDCVNNKTWTEGSLLYMAAFSPQVGGYCGKCIVETHAADDEDDSLCFDVYLWHDGEFPIEEVPPARLHFCDIEQFERFAEKVRALQAQRLQRDQDGPGNDDERAQDTEDREP
jgi:hypothetical protein